VEGKNTASWGAELLRDPGSKTGARFRGGGAEPLCKKCKLLGWWGFLKLGIKEKRNNRYLNNQRGGSQPRGSRASRGTSKGG